MWRRRARWAWQVAVVAGIGAALAGAPVGAPACTTAVVAGAATTNGRPLLWKNRDADDLHNQVVYCADGKYPYIGLVNEGDAAGMQIWAGMNSQGFAIMNAASYNMEADKDTKAEGQFMKIALQSCATVGEFQAFLEKTNAGGRDVSANFGVIDAKGGAAYFETGIHTYRRFNADDPALAPRGFIVRTNYSESADLEKGTGFLRRDRAQSLMEDLVKGRRLNAANLLKDVSRDTANVKIGSFPLAPRKKGAPTFFYTGDSICRHSTSSAALFEGAGAGSDPSLSTAWIILGQPVTGVAVPLWVRAGMIPEELAASPDPAPLTDAFDSVREVLYPDERGDLAHYLDGEGLGDPKTGILQPLLAVEAANFRQAEAAVEGWRTRAPEPAEMAGLERAMAKQTLESVNAVLDARLKNAPGKPRSKRPAPPESKVTVSDLPK